MSKDMLDKLVEVWFVHVSAVEMMRENMVSHPAREVGEDGVPVTRESVLRSLYLAGDMVKQHGPTPGCPMCGCPSTSSKLLEHARLQVMWTQVDPEVELRRRQRWKQTTTPRSRIRRCPAPMDLTHEKMMNHLQMIL